MPEVGLELHSSPCKHWAPRKHAESGPIRPMYDPVRDPKCGQCPHTNFIAERALGQNTASRFEGMRGQVLRCDISAIYHTRLGPRVVEASATSRSSRPACTIFIAYLPSVIS